MILDHRMLRMKASKPRQGQAGFTKDFRTTDNIFVLKSLIDKQRKEKTTPLSVVKEKLMVNLSFPLLTSKADAWQFILLFCRFQEGI